MLRIALITDAWRPQVNGVVRTWGHVIRELKAQSHPVLVIHPGMFRTLPMPRYPEIRLAVLPGRKLTRLLEGYQPDAIHIASEGPVGRAGRRYCRRRGLPFTSSYHTQFPQYLHRYYRVPMGPTYRYLRRFHGAASATLVPTATVGRELEAQGFTGIKVWSRGVDTAMFRPHPKDLLPLPRPIFLCAGRVALEKNIEAFLALDLPGSKVVVGDGPILPTLKKSYPHVHFAGYVFDDQLARYYSCADVFVFPSRTDTFGVVMLEANACGVPVAAYPVTGPIDVVKPGISGALHEDLRCACLDALKVSPDTCLDYARGNTWQCCAATVLESLAIIPRAQGLNSSRAESKLGAA